MQLGSKDKKHLRGSTEAQLHTLAIILNNSLARYCGPYTASSVFLILLLPRHWGWSKDMIQHGRHDSDACCMTYNHVDAL